MSRKTDTMHLGVFLPICGRSPASSVPLKTPRAPFALPGRYVAIVCGSAALVLASAGYLPVGSALGNPWRAVLTVSAATAGLLLLVVSCLTWPLPLAWQRRLDRLRTGVLGVNILLCLGTLGGLAYLTVLALLTPPGQAYISDMLALTHANAQLVLSGHNPYTSDAAYRAAFIHFPSALGTPMRGPVFGTGFDPPTPPTLPRRNGST